MPGVRDTAAPIIAEDEAVRDSLTVLLEAHGLTVRAYERIAGYLHERAADPDDYRALIIYQPTSALGLGIVRELRDLRVVLPAILLAAKVDPASTARAEQLGAINIEAPSEGGALQRAIEAALQASSGTAR